jgi:hypothetical protein
MPGGNPEGVEGDVEDSRIGFCEAAALGGHDRLEEGSQAGDGEPRPLHAVDPVGDDAQPVPFPELKQHGSAAGQAVSSPGEVIEIGLAEASGPPGVGSHLLQQLPEALAGEGRLGDLPPAVGRPQHVVDPTIGRVSCRRVRQPERLQGPLQGSALSPVVVQKGVIDVEENDAKAVQRLTWRGR